jgi:hypothetical protein
MTLLLTTIFSGALWIVLISLQVKPFDALMLCVFLVLIAATVQVYGKFLPGSRRKHERPGGGYTPR